MTEQTNETTQIAPAKKKRAVKKAQPPAIDGGALSPIQQMQAMKSMGMEISDMRDMLALQKEYEANEALKQFNEAMNAFKAEGIEIIKDQHVKYENKDRSLTEYSHSSLSNAVETAIPFLSRHGLSHSWDLDQSSEKGLIKVTCVIKHRAGHSASTSLQSLPDPSGGKNSIQAIASAVKYLERYTFLAITGLAEKDGFDDDGQSADFEEVISPDQEIVLSDLIKETDADKAKFLEYMRCATLGDIPASMYNKAENALNAKKKKVKQS